jgi:hypothetical protein
MADRFGFISTYPPTQCGFATFTASLLGALKRSGVSRRVARLLDAPQPPGGGVVVADIVTGDPPGSARWTISSTSATW